MRFFAVSEKGSTMGKLPVEGAKLLKIIKYLSAGRLCCAVSKIIVFNNNGSTAIVFGHCCAGNSGRYFNRMGFLA